MTTGCQVGSSFQVDDGADEYTGPVYTLSGTVTYDWVPAKDNVSEGGVRLDYTAKAPKPARRVVIVAINSGQEIATAVTDDLGQFSLSVPEGYSVYLRAKAQSTVSAYTADGISPDNCDGASWDIRIANNVTGNSASENNAALRSTYVADGATIYGASQSGISFHVPLTVTGTTYTSRASAPFAILDTAISKLELVCQGAPTLTFPSLTVNWSSNNAATGGSKYLGQIGTSFFMFEGTVPNIYILGQANVDTDEFDDHVVAHELGHYIENTIFRSDSIGGAHGGGDSLDPRVAFGEGYGNAVSAMTFNDPIYVDTSGTGQASGFSINVSNPPTGDDRGVYSETFVQHFLWKLYDERNGTPNSGSFDRIYNVLRNFQRLGPALTTILTFASHYKAIYTETAENIKTLWEGLAQPWNSLCVGACGTMSDVQDLYDTDNDLGEAYNTGSWRYPQATGDLYAKDFWRQYRTLSMGVNATSDHEVIRIGGYSTYFNKFGATRFYRFTPGSTGSRTIAVTSTSAGCGSDTIDMYIFQAGALVGFDEDTDGCPSVTLSMSANLVYIIEVNSVDGTELNSFEITVN